MPPILQKKRMSDRMAPHGDPQRFGHDRNHGRLAVTLIGEKKMAEGLCKSLKRLKTEKGIQENPS
jgi:hypothetical protein